MLANSSWMLLPLKYLSLWEAYINARIKENHKKSQGIKWGDRKHKQCYAGNCIAKQRKTEIYDSYHGFY